VEIPDYLCVIHEISGPDQEAKILAQGVHSAILRWGTVLRLSLAE